MLPMPVPLIRIRCYNSLLQSFPSILLRKQISVSTDECVILKHLLKLLLPSFFLMKNISWRVSPLPRGSLLLVYMYLCSSQSNYSTTREHYEPFWILMTSIIYSLKQYCKCTTNRFLVRSHDFVIIIQLA